MAKLTVDEYRDICVLLLPSFRKGVPHVSVFKATLNSDNSQTCAWLQTALVRGPLPRWGLCFNCINFWEQERNVILNSSCKNLQSGLFCVAHSWSTQLQLPIDSSLGKTLSSLVVTQGYHRTMVSPEPLLPTEMKISIIVSDMAFL